MRNLPRSIFLFLATLLAAPASEVKAFRFCLEDETRHERLTKECLINPDENVRVQGKRVTVIKDNLIINTKNRTESGIAAILEAHCPRDGSGRVYIDSNRVIDVSRLTAIGENGLASSGTIVIDCSLSRSTRVKATDNSLLKIGENKAIADSPFRKYKAPGQLDFAPADF